MSIHRFSKKVKPLFQLTTRYCILIGGRGGGKSYALAAANALSTYEDSFNILYTRYTLTSAELSVIPEFTDKLTMMNIRRHFYIRRHDVVNKATGSTVYFRGIKTSQKTNTASLKSLHKVKRFVIDEAEDFTNEDEFNKIDDSLREKDADIRVILCLNQPDVSHWIYKRFYEKPGLPDDYEGVYGDVTYIPLTYLDNIQNLNPSFLAKIEQMKAENYEKYCHVYLTAWARNLAGLIYTGWERSDEAISRTCNDDCWYGLDWGFSNDPTAIVRLWRDSDTGKLYVCQVCYKRGLLIGQIARIIREDMDKCGNPRALVYCDPARPENIAELRRVYNINACPAVNRDKPGRVDWLKGCDITYWGDDIKQEVDSYCYLPMKDNESVFTDVPQDGNDHAMDAINYGAVTHLRRQGIPNKLGEL